MRPGSRRKINLLVRSLQIPTPWSLEGLVEGVALTRGRPITLSPVIEGLGLFGVWYAGDSQDLIGYHRAAVGAHRDLIVLHELGHMLCGHPSRTPEELMQNSLHDYPRAHEVEAQLFATTLLVRAGQRPIRPATAAQRAAATFGLELPSVLDLANHPVPPGSSGIPDIPLGPSSG